MIVYGDHHVRIGLHEFVAGLKLRLLSTTGASLDETRARLILAGQLEQAAADADLPCASQCRVLTALAAEAFVRQALHNVVSREILGRMEQLLETIGRSAKTTLLDIRTPEGFAWYGLYPEAYAQAADQWAQGVAAGARVLVVGVRSIGTTLASVVSATLRERGLQTADLTVRPQGHPFGRRTMLPADLAPAEHAIVVDEGPGLSGSSMASVADALVARGFSPRAITFLPGHAGGPGLHASPDVRQWWADIPQYSVAWPELRIGKQPTSDLLAQTAQTLLGEPLNGPLQDVGGGQWRRHVGEEDVSANAVAPPLEQHKLLARGRSGRGILFKFAGFALAQPTAGPLLTRTEQQSQRLARLAHAGRAVAPVASMHGWLAIPWVDGRTLRATDADRSVLELVRTHIAHAAGPPLSSFEAADACERLRMIVVCAAQELLGDRAADSAARAADAHARAIASLDGPAYGDGRVAPHEWIRTHCGVLKVDAGGHDDDHTAVGRQPIWWDVAGAAVEWTLNDQAADELAHALGAQGAVLGAYYRCAYAAFRAGVARLCESSWADPAERERFACAVAYYRAHLSRELRRLDRLLPEPPAIVTPVNCRSD
jgi:hypothetical protein